MNLMRIQTALSSLLAFTFLLLFGSSLFATTYNYSFTFKGKRHSLSLDLDSRIIKHYNSKTHYWPTSLKAYPAQAREDAGYEYITDIANQIERQATNAGYSGWDLVQYTTAFVQNLQYQAERQEYVKYPIETLKDKGGDCEDTAILLAALINEMGYDAILVHAPGHMMTAIACSNCSGATLDYKGKDYV